MHTLQAIIFDMDGLMVDSETLSYQAWNEVLRPFNYHLTHIDHSYMIGHKVEESVQMVLQQFPAIPYTAEELIARRREIYKGIRANGVPAMPGLYELNTFLAEQTIPWGIATSSNRAYAQEILGHLRLPNPPRALACGDEVTHGKPAPDVYLLAAHRLNIPPHLCLALEDSSPGCRAATAAGMRVVAIPSDHTKTGDFSFVPYRFGSLHQVLENLELLLGRKIGPLMI